VEKDPAFASWLGNVDGGAEKIEEELPDLDVYFFEDGSAFGLELVDAGGELADVGGQCVVP
jgi:hypothetical protein